MLGYLFKEIMTSRSVTHPLSHVTLSYFRHLIKGTLPATVTNVHIKVCLQIRITEFLIALDTNGPVAREERSGCVEKGPVLRVEVVWVVIFGKETSTRVSRSRDGAHFFCGDSSEIRNNTHTYKDHGLKCCKS